MKYIKYLLLILFFSHWIGWFISLCIVLLLLLTFIFKLLFVNKTKIAKKNKPIFIIIFLFLFLCVANNFNFNNTDFYFFIYQYTSLLIVIIIFTSFLFENILDFNKFSKIIYWISFLTIFFEFIAVNLLKISKDYMPAVRYEYAYYEDFLGIHRPFGLTGQPSANGGILLFCFLLLYEFGLHNKFIITSLIIGTIMTLSGQVVLTNFFIMFILLFKSNFKYKLSIISLFLLFFVFIFTTEFSQKISFDYLQYVLIDELNLNKNFSDLNIIDLIFGTLGSKISYGSEVSIIESIRNYGIFFTLLYWSLIMYITRTKKLNLIIFIAIFLSSLHYPTIFYIEAQIPIALIYIYNKKYNI